MSNVRVMIRGNFGFKPGAFVSQMLAPLGILYTVSGCGCDWGLDLQCGLLMMPRDGLGMEYKGCEVTGVVLEIIIDSIFPSIL